MDERFELCELHRLVDIKRLSEVVDALEARGIETDIWDKSGGLSFGVHPGSSLMVRCADLVYARWVAFSAGLDTWPEEPAGDVG